MASSSDRTANKPQKKAPAYQSGGRVKTGASQSRLGKPGGVPAQGGGAGSALHNARLLRLHVWEKVPEHSNLS